MVIMTVEKAFACRLVKNLGLDHVCSVTWPLNGSEAEGDLVLMQTSLLLLCKSIFAN